MSRTTQVNETTLRIPKISFEALEKLKALIGSKENIILPTEENMLAQPCLMVEIADVVEVTTHNMSLHDSKKLKAGEHDFRTYFCLTLQFNDRPSVNMSKDSNGTWAGLENFVIPYQFMAKLYQILGYPDGSKFLSEEEQLQQLQKDNELQELFSLVNYTDRRIDDEEKLVAYRLARRLLVAVHKRLENLRVAEDEDETIVMESAWRYSKKVLRRIFQFDEELRNTPSAAPRWIGLFEMEGVDVPDRFDHENNCRLIVYAKHILNNLNNEWWLDHLTRKIT